MSETSTCHECGKALQDNSAHGLCPACLMKLALRTQATEAASSPPPRETPSLEEVAAKFSQYEIVECLGRGGMGVVYKARQRSLERWVAIKILAPERVRDPLFTERFEREAKMLARMSHPNIVTVFDHGRVDDLFYIVMEYVDGVNLRDLLQDGKMAPEQALAIIPPICEALEYAHAKDVVHRDIKPENLLLDRDGRVKIADFGIASLIGTNGGRSGTPPYMAPEQDQGRSDRRADIYSLGVVLYEMLTGERPEGDLLAPSRKAGLDARIDEIVMQALEKEPSRRYQTANEFRTRVQTVAASPPPVPAAPQGLSGGPLPSPAPASIGVVRTPMFTEDSVRNQFRVLAVTWWIGMTLGAIGSLSMEEEFAVIGLIGLIPLIVAVVLSCILLYRQWFLLQGHGARTTPGKAVGFGFIPFYCFYWWFVAYVGLAEDTNRHLENSGNTTTRMSYGLAMTYCILGIVGCTIGLLPVVGSFTTLVSMIVGYVFLLHQRRCLLAMLDLRLNPSPPARAA